MSPALKLYLGRTRSPGRLKLLGPYCCVRHAHDGRRQLKTLSMIIAVLSAGGAHAALPKHARINAMSMTNLISGADICGDDAHSTSCLKIVPCAEVDTDLACTLEDPVWVPELVTLPSGAVTGSFRDVLGLPRGSNVNKNTLGASAVDRLVSDAAFFSLPRARALYRRRNPTHKKSCAMSAQDGGYCVIPDAIRTLAKITNPDEAEAAFPTCKVKVRIDSTHCV